jgi:hypothetical protein
MPPPPDRFKIPVVFGLFFSLVWGASVLLHQSESEEKLIRMVQNHLEKNGLTDLIVSFDGSNGHLTGVVESMAVKEKAAYLVALVAEVQGVTAVDADAVKIRDTGVKIPE